MTKVLVTGIGLITPLGDSVEKNRSALQQGKSGITSLELLGLPSSDESTKERHEWLVLDGHILKKSPLDVLKSQVQQTPKLVLGSTAHESHSENFMALYTEWTVEVITEYVNNSIIGQLNLTDEALKR